MDAAAGVAPAGANTERIDERETTGLELEVHRQWLARAQACRWWETIMDNARWYRVKYKSHR